MALLLIMVSQNCNKIFEQVITDYHQFNDIDLVPQNPFQTGTLENLLYDKCWIDTAQWHMEDEIRNPSIEPGAAVQWKRRIDKSNQDRTDIVEVIDDYFYTKYQNIQPKESARFNTESPAGAIDRLSILQLKIYHMREQAERTDISEEQREKNTTKLDILLQQREDLSLAIDELLEDIEKGDKYMKVYRQMKMYNDPDLNPVLYKK
ncbi:DUF4254 domain-containing protein [Mucilaginibacter auburnensis]|uniref:Uncharacterized protein DUF4254 n=1 Tax=Mucilaginibacter auburnensis TaxID=1457233 RepID=A0A2H9VUP5_9SPHI|nr:DUF4254 domain-containing protein [Mucilaginibacter auburnensis]PJJ84535.1 uncharacterized protein DUF4254 [Mucilaginibacter auburnensis]